MNVWNMAFDAWNELDREKRLSTDQRVTQANTLALLAIGQELSLIRHQGINPEFDASSD
jgi:hypothetical protein